MLSFRDITPQDHDIILPMVRDFYQTDAVLHPVDESILERTFRDAADASEPLCYSAEVGGRCVFLEEIYLLPQFRGKGLGLDILSWIEQSYPGVRRLRLEVNEVNQGAVHLYEKAGYTYLRYEQMIIDKVK